MSTVNYLSQTFGTPVNDGSDSYALLMDQTQSGSTISKCTITGNGAEWGLKLPDVTSVTVTDTTLIGGTERALDIVRGGNHAFVRCTFGPGADRPATSTVWSMAKTCDAGIKGDATGVAFNTCTMTDLLVGDYSIYDHDTTLAPVSGITLTDCVHPKGPATPILIRCLNGDKPTLIRTNAKILKVPGFIVAIYFWYCRHFGDTRTPLK